MRLALATLLFLAIPTGANAMEPRHLQGTALVLPQKEVAWGLFSPLRYGVLPQTEISTHPILFFLRPNATVKRAWVSGSFYVSSEHSLAYETLLLKSIARDGIGGILPNNSVIPQIFSLANSVLLTKIWSPRLITTGSVEVTLSPSFGSSDFATIDLPLVYQRTASFHSGVSMRAGLDVEGQLSGRFHYLLDVDLWWMPRYTTTWAVESKIYVMFKKSRHFAILAGTKIVHGAYPFGHQTHLIPICDFLWSY